MDDRLVIGISVTDRLSVPDWIDTSKNDRIIREELMRTLFDRARRDIEGHARELGMIVDVKMGGLEGRT